MTVIKYFPLTLFHLTPFSLDSKKPTLSNNVSTKIAKVNADLFSILVSNVFNESLTSCKFLSVLKLADVMPVHKKNQGLKNLAIYQLVYYLKFQTFLKGGCIDKFQNILKLCL